SRNGTVLVSSVSKWSLSFEEYSPSVAEIECALRWLKNKEDNITRKNIIAVLGVKSPLRRFHPISKSDHPSKVILQKISYAEIDGRCFMYGTKFVALRTIIYVTIYIYTQLKK